MGKRYGKKEKNFSAGRPSTISTGVDGVYTIGGKQRSAGKGCAVTKEKFHHEGEGLKRGKKFGVTLLLIFRWELSLIHRKNPAEGLYLTISLYIYFEGDD